MTARTKRTDEIRARFNEDSSDAYQNILDHAPADLEYLLARVERLEGLLREVQRCAFESAWDALYPETSDRIDAALGDES